MNITGVIVSDDMKLLDLGFDALSGVVEVALREATTVIVEGVASQAADIITMDGDEHFVVIEFTAQGGEGV